MKSNRPVSHPYRPQRLCVPLLSIAGPLLVAGAVRPTELSVERLNDGQPIVSQQPFVAAGSEFAAQGENINGRSMIRVPDWLAPAGRFNQDVAPVALGFAYFRVFDLAGRRYAVASRGTRYQARDPADPFIPPPGFDFSQELWLPLGSSLSDNPFQKAIDAAQTAGELRPVGTLVSAVAMAPARLAVGGSL